jgi:hypothetical protein
MIRWKQSHDFLPELRRKVQRGNYRVSLNGGLPLELCVEPFDTLDVTAGKDDYRAMTGATGRWTMQRDKPRNWVTAFNENYNVLFGQVCLRRAGFLLASCLLSVESIL